MSSALIDFGPGERHIFKWVGKKCYYVPELFHMSPTTQSNQPIKLFINDIQQSKSLIQIYGGIGYDKQRQNYIMVNNYPIRHVSIFGKLISCNEKTREDKKKKKKDDYNNNKSNTFYICRIDDSSGRHLMMDCVINESVFMDFDPQLTFSVEVQLCYN